MNDGDKAKSLLIGWTLLNLNDQVQIKLTDRGRDIYFHKDDWMNKKGNLPNGYFPQRKPKEVDGWFEEQLWTIMQIFGRHMGMGFDPAFVEMRIKA